VLGETTDLDASLHYLDFCRAKAAAAARQVPPAGAAG
jgi:hypothetical protein